MEYLKWINFRADLISRMTNFSIFRAGLISGMTNFSIFRADLILRMRCKFTVKKYKQDYISLKWSKFWQTSDSEIFRADLISWMTNFSIFTRI